VVEIRRLSHSCLVVTTETTTVLIDPGVHSFNDRKADLESLEPLDAIIITHSHQDHIDPAFVSWLKARNPLLTVHGNQAVTELLRTHGIDVVTSNPPGVTSEDVDHEETPLGPGPPNRAFTIGNRVTHPGDSYRISRTAPILTMAMMSPWGSTRQSVECIRQLNPRIVIPVHDAYMSEAGRKGIWDIVTKALSGDGIDLIPLDWGETYRD
jgi:L-ascorbate metabolism protein UlaG (beta-lactamase superfamily)